MKLFEYVREGDWSVVAGYGLFVALMVAGYCYNITFVPLISLLAPLVGGGVAGYLKRRGAKG